MRVVTVSVLVPCVLAALLTGCAEQPRAPVAPPPPGVQAFNLTGRLSVRYEDKNFSGGLRWQHRDDGDELAFTSPLGQTIAQLSSGAGGARLLTSENKLYRAPSVEQLVRETLGWELPLTGLSHWVLGRTMPGATVNAPERDADDRLTGFVQDAWRVHIAAYAPRERGSFPSRMQLSYGDLEIRLVIDALKAE